MNKTAKQVVMGILIAVAIIPLQMIIYYALKLSFDIAMIRVAAFSIIIAEIVYANYCRKTKLPKKT